MVAVPLAAGAVALVAVIIGTWQAIPKPPALTIISIEPAGMFDDRGEMSQVTLSISNQETARLPEKGIYVRNLATTGNFEARVSNAWIAVEGALDSSLGSGQKRDTLIVLPAGADCCRVTLRYTGSAPSFKMKPFRGRLEWLAERLPLVVRSRVPGTFWRWVGFGPNYVPRSDWRTITVEIPILPIRNAPSSVL